MSEYKINRLSYVEFDHEPTPDELMHFKYIKREKVNGKWRYWYEKAKDAVEDAKMEAEIAVADPIKRAKENFDWGYKLGNKRDSGGGVLNTENLDPKKLRKYAETSERLAKTYLDTHMYRPRSMDDNYRFLDASKSAEKDAAELRKEARRAESTAGKLGQMTGRTVRRIQHQSEKGKEWLDDFLKRR